MIDRDASFYGYRVERLLGRGGMGVVYEAVQTSLERRVALKVLRPELAEDPAFVDRFRREGRLQASLEHPNVLDVYEVGEGPQGLFLAMRLIDGPTLAELLRKGDLSAELALRLLGQVGSALDAAHTAGLVHRDVKPQNVLVGADDHAFLADFGLSRAGEDTATASRPSLGTVAYVAPEVIRGETPGPASDRYAFAATLFHCLTGDVVFPRGSHAAALYAHASEAAPSISERRPDLPRALDRHFEAALAKDPAGRPASAQAIVEAVRETLETRGLAALGPPDLAGRSEPAPVTLRQGPARGAEEATSRHRLAVLAAVVGAAALGAGFGVLVASDSEGEPRVEPVPIVAEGAEPLGSDLGLPDRSLDCRGREPSPASPSCSIVQVDSPGAQLVAPADGAIVGWAVRGASGEVALDVIRPGGDETVRVARSQWESAGNAAAHSFPVSLAVERGDLIGVELGPGAAIGIRETGGSTTQRWRTPEGGFYGSPDLEPGTGFDYEVLLRADFVAGAEAETPKQLDGAEAARAADGRVRERAEVEISKPAATVNVELVEVGNRVALDLVRGDRRVERSFVPDLVPGGQPIDMKTYTEGGEFSQVGIWWVNPNTGRTIFHFFNVSRHQIEFLG